jgi:diaminohydroxyphosphoribosylaminopyrimidine deaminase / 5-amino-6-(5-phosphoribosylamino)uracil reductase
MSKKPHTIWLDQAARLAWKGARNVFPNPMVGAVLVKNNQIISEGFHAQHGEPHAEIEAISNTKDPTGATLYVTLEPCCHHGKTPPCTESILKAGIKKVVYALKDPNPKISGQGAEFLKKNGLEVELIATPKTDHLNAIYLTNTLQKRPFIHLKTALTLDHKITLQKGKGTPLTNQLSNQKTHELRAQYDAILVGVGTILADDPELTVRHVPGENPIRIVLDRQNRAPKSARIRKEPPKTIIIQDQAPLQEILENLFQDGISSILVEGGAQISASFLEEKLVDRLSLIYTPNLTKNQNLPEFPINKIPANFSSQDATLLGPDLWVDLTC